MHDVALTIQNILGGKHLKLCAGQLAVAARTQVLDIAAVLIGVSLIDSQFRHDRLVRRFKLGCFVRFDRSIQRDLFKEVSDSRAILLDNVPAFADRFRDRYAVCVRHHARRQTFAVLVVVVKIKAHTLDGISVQAIRLGQLDIAFRRLVLHFNLDGLHVFRINGHFDGVVVVHEMHRHNRLFHTIGAPS